MKVLIVGGYGVFGGRLVELLADRGELTLFVAGRSLENASVFCRRDAKARLVPTRFDRDGDLAGQLATLAPDLVVDASGPFQAYGAEAYKLVGAALNAGADYLDLADAKRFVAGIGDLDDLAKNKARFALSGVSSFPVLTAAAVRALAPGMRRIDTITAGIAPSPFAGVGMNVVRAIASYSGKPITIRSAGREDVGYGFVDSRVMQVNTPGHVPLPPIRFGLVDVPDLQVLANEWPEAQTVWAGAGPTPAVLHRLLWAAGQLVRGGVLPSLTPFAPLMNAIINTVRWGEHRGGMIVRVTGQTSGGEETRSWHLLAEGDDGLLIPSMAAAAIICNCLSGRSPEPGARPAHRDLELADYAPLFAAHRLHAGIRIASSKTSRLPLYEQVMGEAFSRLPAPVQALHRLAKEARFVGQANVRRGGGKLAGFIANMFGFPQPGPNIPIVVTFSERHGVETWQRNFGGKCFSSRQSLGRGRYAGLLLERFGPFAFALAVVERDHSLRLIVRHWSILGIPMPRWLAPQSDAYEHDADHRFNFSVSITLPLIGLVVHYRGWLIREDK